MKTRKKIKLVPANNYVQLGTTGTGRSYAVKPTNEALFFSGVSQKSEAAAVAIMQQAINRNQKS